jgi:hypothetical protein
MLMTCWTVVLTPSCILVVLFEGDWEKMTIGYTATKNSPGYLTFIYAGQTTMLACLRNSRLDMPK